MSKLMIKGQQASGTYANASDIKINEISGMTASNTQEALVALNNSLTKLITIGNGTTNATVNTTSTYAYPSGVSKTTHALVCAEVLCSGNWRSDQLANVYMGDSGLACAPISSVATSQPLRIVYLKIS